MGNKSILDSDIRKLKRASKREAKEWKNKKIKRWFKIAIIGFIILFLILIIAAIIL